VLHLKVIACEIAFREICHLAAGSANLIDLEFLTQGHHDHPEQGRTEVQQKIEAVPPGKYDAILLGYGLCSNILAGLHTAHTPLVIPRAHDCITLFLGSKERYQKLFNTRPGTYYYTSGWLECRRRRGGKATDSLGAFLPANAIGVLPSTYLQWVEKYGEEKARYLVEVMDRWTEHYTHGALIDYDFTKGLGLTEQVQRICSDRGWKFEQIEGDLSLLQRWLAGDWPEDQFLIVPPSQQVVPTYDEKIVGLSPHDPNGE